jgi:hypothetical protein
VTQAAVAASAFVKVLMKGALSQVWGMINGMQLIVHVPLFAVKIPDSTMSVTGVLIEIATFDVPYLSLLEIFGEKSLPDPEEV